MSDDIVPIRPLPKGIVAGSPVNKSVVALLEKYLDQARCGEINGIAVALSRPNGEINSFWSSTDAQHKVMAAIACLQWEYARDMMDPRP